MNFFQLKLVPRLVLASLVLPAALLLYQLALWLYPDGAGWFGYLWYTWVPPFYDIPFALLVLAPFITASRGRWFRALALVVVAALVYFAAVGVVVDTRSILHPWTESPYLGFVNMVPTALVATWLLAGATAWIGPLHVSRRYWIYTGIAGLVSGFGFLASEMYQQYTRTDGEWYSYYGPYWFWPVATCVAIYCGREK